MARHNVLDRIRRDAKTKDFFVPNATAVRRKLQSFGNDDANINQVTGERVNYDDDVDYIDISHEIRIVPAYKKAHRDYMVGTEQNGVITIMVNGQVKDLSEKDRWQIFNDEIAKTQWYNVKKLMPEKVADVVVRYMIELEPEIGNQVDEEDF